LLDILRNGRNLDISYKHFSLDHYCVRLILIRTTASANSGGSSSALGGATAGIAIGASAGIALLGAPWFLIARRHRSAGETPPVYVEEGQRTDLSMTYRAREADGAEPQVSEVSAANVEDHWKKRSAQYAKTMPCKEFGNCRSVKSSQSDPCEKNRICNTSVGVPLCCNNQRYGVPRILLSSYT
jgi:hypothetical protein